MFKELITFIYDSIRIFFQGGKSFYTWMTILTLIAVHGIACYIFQFNEGLQVTGMSDQVVWALYISNFTFFVGIAAAAVMLIIPLYVFHDKQFLHAVLIGEAVAVAALSMCLMYIVVDMGRPDRFWHMIPFIGHFNWPNSMLAWDVIALNGYLALNLCIPFYLIFTQYRGKTPNKSYYLPFVFLSIFWAISIHTVTAFLYAGLTARPYWNSSILGPRFLASAFCAGPSFIILLLTFIHKHTSFKTPHSVIDKLALTVTVAAQINLFLLGCEIFKDFYSDNHHSLSIQYLFFGLDGHKELVPWIWSAVAMNIVATTALTINQFIKRKRILYLACMTLFIAIWIEKGMGLIIPGFIPSPMGEVVPYSPTYPELGITIGIAAIGLIILTCLIRMAIPVVLGHLTYQDRDFHWRDAK